jgi:hypothetical protein
MKKNFNEYKILKSLISAEQKMNKIFFKTEFNYRKIVTDNFIVKNFDTKKIYKRKILDVNYYFNLKSYIARSALLNPQKKPKYFFEPQTTKLLRLINICLNDTIIAGAFIGDQACLLAKQNKKNKIYAFEPDKINFKFLKINKNINKLNNLNIVNKCLYKNDNTFLQLEKNISKNKDQAFITSIKKRSTKKPNTTSIDSFLKKNKINNIRTIVADVEGNELNILIGALKTLNTTCVNVIFEIHSSYLDFTKGILNLKIIKFLKKLNFTMYAIRDDHDNVGKYEKIELINLNKVFYKGPCHGFNILATKDKNILNHRDVIILNKTLSPKYLLYKKSFLFHPVVN